MAYRDILVHVPGYRTWLPHVRYAARIARRLDARLAGAFTVEQPYSAAELQHAPLIAATLIEQLAHQRSEAENAGARFHELAREAGAERSDWLVGQGDPIDVIAYAGASRDLLVAGPVRGTLHSSPMLVGRLVVATRMPCLIVPEAFEGAECAFECVAVAWNESVESARALHAAMPLLIEARRVVVLGGRPRDYTQAMKLPPFNPESYLATHGISAELRHVECADDSGQSLPRLALEAGADLLVMGAYGRTRFSEWVLGGATRHALHESAIPLLMHH